MHDFGISRMVYAAGQDLRSAAKEFFRFQHGEGPNGAVALLRGDSGQHYVAEVWGIGENNHPSYPLYMPTERTRTAGSLSYTGALTGAKVLVNGYDSAEVLAIRGAHEIINFTDLNITKPHWWDIFVGDKRSRPTADAVSGAGGLATVIM